MTRRGGLCVRLAAASRLAAQLPRFGWPPHGPWIANKALTRAAAAIMVAGEDADERSK
jgi:hypothetical protein